MTENDPSHVQPDFQSNFRLPHFLTLITAIEALILFAAALQLYSFPLWEGLRWPWPVKPYNAVFLGGLYWSAFATVAFQLLVRRWATARLVQAMVLIFSAVILSVSLAYLGLFDWQRRLVKAWFLVYAVVPASAAIATFAYRDRPCATAIQLPPRYKLLLALKGLCLGLYGLVLLMVPGLSTAFWPWLIDAFHARLYSAIFFASGFGNWMLSRSSSALELLVLGVVELLLGALPLVGILNIDRTIARIDWSLPGAMLWLMLLGIWVIAGLDLIRQSLRWKPISQSPSS